MFQVLNSLSLLLFCASAGFTGRRVLHAGLLAGAVGLDCLIATLLHMQRAVIGRASVEVASSPVKALHIATAVAGLLLLIACLVAAIRRWRGDRQIGPWGIGLLAVALTVRAVAFGTSFLMNML